MTSDQNQYKFTEGEIHQFKVAGYTEIPGTDESFLILTPVQLVGNVIVKLEPKCSRERASTLPP